MRLNKLTEAEHWYRESLRAKPDHIPAHLTYGKLLALTVSCSSSSLASSSSFVSFFSFASSPRVCMQLINGLCGLV